MNDKITCRFCVMDSSAYGIKFDDNGQCNYCKNFIKKLKDTKPLDLKKLISSIKKNKNKKSNYDCIIGLSGGIDSSYALVKAVEIGLNPLAVHLDNGWNSELAQNNIENLVKSLNVDLFTHVINWTEYKNMMQAFFESDVIDIEILMDNAMLSINYQIAKKEKLKFILTGSNTSTEGMSMPSNMNWIKFDKRNIKSIVKKFSNQKIKTFPIIGIYDLVKYILFHRIRWVNFLDYFNYKKNDAKEYLVKKFNFKPYPYKHYESVFTRFYQGYLLPKKFKIDKRILHLSTLIVTNQITRDEAISLLKNSPYVSKDNLQEDIDFFLKKMDWNLSTLQDYLNRSPIPHTYYPNSFILYNVLLKIYKILKF